MDCCNGFIMFIFFFEQAVNYIVFCGIVILTWQGINDVLEKQVGKYRELGNE